MESIMQISTILISVLALVIAIAAFPVFIIGMVDYLHYAEVMPFYVSQAAEMKLIKIVMGIMAIALYLILLITVPAQTNEPLIGKLVQWLCMFPLMCLVSAFAIAWASEHCGRICAYYGNRHHLFDEEELPGAQ